MQKTTYGVEKHLVDAKADEAQKFRRCFQARAAQCPVASTDNSAGRLRSNRLMTGFS
jgi:hypothetical protein